MYPAGPPVYGCTTCGAPLPQGSDRCTRCGTLHGDHRRCEQCGARAEVVKKDGYVYVCAACGKPRVPMERPGVVKSGRERVPLAKVAEARRDATVSQVGGVIAFSIAGAIALFSLLMLIISATAFMVVLGLALGVSTIGIFGMINAKKNRALAQVHAKEALASVALDVLRTRGAMSATMLADQLGIPEDIAEKSLEALPEKPEFRVETVIDEHATDGLLRYRIADGAAAIQPGMSEEDAEKAAFDAKLAAAVAKKQQQGPR